MKISNCTKNTILAEEAVLAAGIFKRLKGLLGKKTFEPGQAIILKPCNSIHTFFMRFPIDVLFVDKDNQVIKALSSLAPFSFSPIYIRAKLAIELPAGTILSTLTQEGDILNIK